MSLTDELAQLATDNSFSGVIRVDRGGATEVRAAYGLANRAAGVPMGADTQLGLASGGKGFTAVMVLSLVEEGLFELSTPVRAFLGADLPLVGDATMEHLLGHTSGIGDYIDEEAIESIDEYVLTVPVHDLADTERFLPMLEGHPPKHAPGERFSYCNGGFVILALVAERAAGRPYHELVLERVCRPAGLAHTEFLRTDEPSPTAAVGYMSASGLRTNVLHLPVRGTGDGGICSTVDDLARFWAALLDGQIVSKSSVEAMIRPRSDVPEESARYGLGFWVHPTEDVPMLVGYDAGVSFRSAFDPRTRSGYTVISNTSEGVWPLARHLSRALFGS